MIDDKGKSIQKNKNPHAFAKKNECKNRGTGFKKHWETMIKVKTKTNFSDHYIKNQCKAV